MGQTDARAPPYRTHDRAGEGVPQDPLTHAPPLKPRGYCAATATAAATTMPTAATVAGCSSMTRMALDGELRCLPAAPSAGETRGTPGGHP